MWHESGDRRQYRSWKSRIQVITVGRKISVTVPFPEDVTELLVDMSDEDFKIGVAEDEDKADFSDDDENI